MRSPFAAMILACGLLLLLPALGGAACSALAQSREIVAGLSGRPVPAAADWSGRASAGIDRRAARELEAARSILAQGNLQEGRRRLEVLVARYPDAGASDEARSELGRLYTSSVGRGRIGSAADRPARDPRGIGMPTGGDARLPVSVGASVPAPGAVLAQGRDAWTGQPRLVRAAEQEFRMEVGDRVFFADQSAVLDARARSLLAAQARWLKRVPGAAVSIEGHADDQGGAAWNDDLAARRAQAVRERLIAEGVAAARIKLEAYGRDRPVALCADARCAAHNRRVVTLLRGTRSVPDETPTWQAAAGESNANAR